MANLLVGTGLHFGGEGFWIATEHVFLTIHQLSHKLLQAMECHLLDAVIDVRHAAVQRRQRNNAAKYLGAVAVLVAVLIVRNVAGAPLVSVWTSIEEVSPLHFDAARLKVQDEPVTALWFFRDDREEDKAFQEQYSEFAASMIDFVRSTAINCNKWESFCKKNTVQLTPVLKVYAADSGFKLPYRSHMESAIIAREVIKRIPDHTVQLDSKFAVDTFFATHQSWLKVVLFSKAKATPPILRALSSSPNFRHRVKFAFAAEKGPQILRSLKVSEFPALVAFTERQERWQYQGDLNSAAITRWVSELLFL